MFCFQCEQTAGCRACTGKAGACGKNEGTAALQDQLTGALIGLSRAVAEAFGCGVNDLPLSMVLSWYEQKAVCILLTLLHLGIRGIRLGPTLPAFVSPNVLKRLVGQFGIAPITTPEQDMEALLNARR